MIPHFPLPARARYVVLSGLMLATAILQPVSVFAHCECGSWSWGGGHNLLSINYDSNCSPFTGVARCDQWLERHVDAHLAQQGWQRLQSDG
jgi:hypothetical protein